MIYKYVLILIYFTMYLVELIMNDGFAMLQLIELKTQPLLKVALL